MVELGAGPVTAARGRQAGWTELLRTDPDVQYVQFVDGDCILDRDWLAKAVACLDADQTLAGVCGRRREERGAESFYSRLVDIDWDIPAGEVDYFGGDALVRVEALKSVGGWSTDLIAGEEPDLCFRLRDRGWRILRLDAEQTRHDVGMTHFGQYWRRAVRSGFAYAEVANRNRQGTGRVWARQVRSMLAYGAVLPIVFMAVVVAGWPLVAALAALAYLRLLIVLTRHAQKRNRSWRESLAYAAVETVCKMAGAVGAAKFWMKGGGGKIIEYKSKEASDSILRRAVDGAADAGAWGMQRASRATAGAMRFVRLCRLRGMVRGTVPLSTQFDGAVRAERGTHLDLGERCRLGRDVFFETQGEGKIRLGKNVTVNSGCVLVAYEGITVGDHSLIGEYVSIRDANHGIDVGRPMRLQPHSAEAIEIGADVWIGRGCAILKGVRIGSGAVVAANSVVTRDVPAMTVVAGSPAQVIKRRQGVEDHACVEGL